MNIQRLNQEKVMKGLNVYIEGILSQNDSLQKQLNEYNKEEEIQKLQNEIKQMRENALLIFSEQEKKDARAFSEEHYQSCKSNSIYQLEGTGIGTSITMICKKCGTQKNITDTSNW